jgi:DNA-binding response OmpR family regulator
MRLLLVEDEPDLGAAIQQTLTQSAYVVDWVQDGDMAWKYLTSSWIQYEIAILDWMLPGLSGIELCQRLRQQAAAFPILILTARDSLEDKVMGLDAGADDYLVKPFGMAELLARLRALQRRPQQLQAPQLQAGEILLDYNTRTVTCPAAVGKVISLTTKELQLLEYLMRHPNQVLSTEQIRSQLWTLGSDSFSNVVAAQMRLLRKKLADLGCQHSIETVRGVGYRLMVSPEEHAKKSPI